MEHSLQKLQKFLKLEAERGYDNRAVVGGFERMVDAWQVEARNEGLAEDLIQVISERLRDYHRLNQNSRKETIEGLWKRIQRSTGVEVELDQIKKTPRPPRSSPPSRPVDQPTPQATPSEPVKDSRPHPPTRSRKQIPDEEKAALDAPITVLQGVGPRNANTLSRLGLRTLRDMLYYFPRRYVDFTQLKTINRLQFGDEVTILGTLQSVTKRRVRDNKVQLVEAVVHDGSGAIKLTWFNQPWIMKRLQSGAQYTFAGKIDQFLGRLVMNNPEVEPVEQQQLSTNRIVPNYSLTDQITQRWLRRLMNQVVTFWAPRICDPLPEDVLESAGLEDLSNSLVQIHFPDSWEQFQAARQRLAFDEVFLLQLGVLNQKRAWQERTARSFETSEAWLEAQLKRLPFPLTGAQQRALQVARNDLVSGHPMNRLIQGDVGSGKTVIAGLIAGMVTRHGAQAALMAPTSILAEQHYNKMVELLAGYTFANKAIFEKPDSVEPPVTTQPIPPLQPNEIRLMIGATPESEKQEIREGLANGTIKFVIGTHALIEEPVAFADLQLVIVDEQHRFGVEQRAALRSKGTNPHLLVMTATPIPRSLALSVYGDLDLSVIDEMPPGRQVISTYVLLPSERERAYQLIRKQVGEGFQAFIIYPLVEESPVSEAKAAVEEHARLQNEIFPDYRLGLLHGRLSAEEKETVMSQFHRKELQILVSTSVIEVGVDVPNATVMLIEGANRFGLAQLHQFRGRVGRGAEKSFCLLIPENADKAENERLQIMATTNDGFVLAERDLEQRGPGEFLGKRQSGFTGLRLANLTDIQLIEKARAEAIKLFERDPHLTHPEHKLLAEEFKYYWGAGQGDIS